MAAPLAEPTRALRVGILSTDGAWRTALAQRLAPVEDLRVVRHGDAAEETDVEAVLTHGVDVLVLDFAGTAEPPGAWRKAWESMSPGTRPRLVVVADPLTPEVFRACVAVGAREVAVRSAPLPDLTEAVYRSVQAADLPSEAALRAVGEPEPPLGRLVVTLFSLRGGSGKTTLGIELAAALGRRLGRSVALLDLALGLGQVGTALGLRAARPLGELLTDGASLDAETFRTYLSGHPAGLEVLCAPESPEVAEYVRQSHVAAMVAAARAGFPATVIDTSSGLGEADSVLLVLGPDLPSVAAARLALQLFDRFDVSRAKVGLVLNRWRGLAPAPADVESALGVPVWSVIGEDPNCLTAMNRGVPVYAVRRTGPVVQGAEALATRLVGAAAQAARAARRGSRTWGRSAR